MADKYLTNYAGLTEYDEAFLLQIQAGGGLARRVTTRITNSRGQTYKWGDRSLSQTTWTMKTGTTFNNTSDTTLSLTSNAGVTVGKLYHLGDSLEVLRVTAVSGGGEDVTVTRAIGGTTKEAGTAGEVLHEVGMSDVEGGSGESLTLTDPTVRTNYFWKMHAIYGITGEAEETDGHYGDTADQKWANALYEATQVLQRQASKMTIYGAGVQSAAATGGSFTGIFQMINGHSSGASVTNIAGVATIQNLDDMVTGIGQAGGMCTAIAFNPSLAPALRDFLEVNKRTTPGEDMLGGSVSRYHASDGTVVDLVPDYYIVPTHIVALDEAELGYVFKSSLTSSDIGETASDVTQRKLRGTMTLAWNNAANRGRILRGVTGF